MIFLTLLKFLQLINLSISSSLRLLKIQSVLGCPVIKTLFGSARKQEDIINLKISDDTKKYPFLTKMSYPELYAKIEFILDNDYKLEMNGQLNPIFEMSDVNMQIQYRIKKEELIKKYYLDKKKRGK